MSGRGPEGNVLGAALAEQDDRLSNCVHCGFCLPACPTYVRLGDEADSPRGRLHLMRAVAEGRLDAGSEAFQRHIDRCLGCRACETVCPSGVEYGYLLERARGVAAAARPRPVPTRGFLALIRSPFLLRLWMGATRLLRWSRLGTIAARVTPTSERLRTLRLGAAMLEASRPWRPPRAPVAVETTTSPSGLGEPRGRVALLRGCVQDHLFRRVNEATARTLGANGWEVVRVDDQGCCGALHAHAGALSEARGMAVRNVRAFREAGVDWIVANAAGCGATLREYESLMEGDPVSSEDATWFSDRVRDVSELLWAPDRPTRLGAPLPLTVAYDPPCHLLHGQRVDAAPVRLLESIPELEVLPVPSGEECCGGAGIYGITHPDLGGRIGGDKVNAVRETGASVLATGNPGCAMQIGAGLFLAGEDIQVAHPVELLDESYRRGGLYDV